MWVSATNGDLVNLDSMESVQTVGLSVNAQINALTVHLAGMPKALVRLAESCTAKIAQASEAVAT